MNDPRRGRPRDESCGPAILAAAIELVGEVGIAALTMDAVAARAGVGKATIYRRWSSKEALMLDAWKSAVQKPDAPDTGSLREDLRVLFAPHDQQLSGETMQRIFPQMIAAAKVNPEVGEAYREFIAERRRPMRTVLERAVGRGDLPADSDLDLVHDLLVAPILYRWMVSDGVVDDDVIERLIAIVVAGATSSLTTARR